MIRLAALRRPFAVCLAVVMCATVGVLGPRVVDEPAAREAPVVGTFTALLDGWTTSFDGDVTPAWARGRRPRVVLFEPEGRVDDVERGSQLAERINALEPGDFLQVPTGTYVIDDFFDVRVSGTEAMPIWIAARPGDRVVLTRPDRKQNVVNVGSKTRVSHLVLQGLEITGGSMGLRLVRCNDVWVDQCHVHHTGGPGITANQADTDRLAITRNHVHDTDGTGEGMYLGANWSVHRMSRSLIALNRVHDCGGSQGDGIEVKQGSWGNLVVANDVRRTKGPCIIAYGTDGRPVNVIEHNLCIRSRDNVLQVQGEALVRHNLLVDGAYYGLHSHDHQGATRDLVVERNTIVTRDDATDLFSWGRREGMVFRSNVVYSESGASLRFPLGSADVDVAGNVVRGRTMNVPDDGATTLDGELSVAMRELGAVPALVPRR